MAVPDRAWSRWYNCALSPNPIGIILILLLSLSIIHTHASYSGRLLGNDIDLPGVHGPTTVLHGSFQYDVYPLGLPVSGQVSFNVRPSRKPVEFALTANWSIDLSPEITAPAIQTQLFTFTFTPASITWTNEADWKTVTIDIGCRNTDNSGECWQTIPLALLQTSVSFDAAAAAGVYLTFDAPPPVSIGSRVLFDVATYSLAGFPRGQYDSQGARVSSGPGWAWAPKASSINPSIQPLGVSTTTLGVAVLQQGTKQFLPLSDPKTVDQVATEKLPIVLGFTSSGAWSMALWFRADYPPTAVGQTQTLWYTGPSLSSTDTTDAIILDLIAIANPLCWQLRLRWFGPGSAGTITSSLASGVRVGLISHLVITSAVQTAPAPLVKLWLNTVSVASSPTSISARSRKIHWLGSSVYDASSVTVPDTFFTGMFASIHFFSRTLVQTEIIVLAANPPAGLTPFPLTLAGWSTPTPQMALGETRPLSITPPGLYFPYASSVVVNVSVSEGTVTPSTFHLILPNDQLDTMIFSFTFPATGAPSPILSFSLSSEFPYALAQDKVQVTLRADTMTDGVINLLNTNSTSPAHCYLLLGPSMDMPESTVYVSDGDDYLDLFDPADTVGFLHPWSSASPPSAFTMHWWIQTRGLSGTPSLFYWAGDMVDPNFGTQRNSEIWVRISATTGIHFGWSQQFSSYVEAFFPTAKFNCIYKPPSSATNPLMRQLWSQLLVTVDGLDAKIYIDGVMVRNCTSTFPIPNVPRTTGYMMNAAPFTPPLSSALLGRLGGFAFLNRAFNPAEVLTSTWSPPSTLVPAGVILNPFEWYFTDTVPYGATRGIQVSVSAWFGLTVPCQFQVSVSAGSFYFPPASPNLYFQMSTQSQPQTVFLVMPTDQSITSVTVTISPLSIGVEPITNALTYVMPPPLVIQLGGTVLGLKTFSIHPALLPAMPTTLYTDESIMLLVAPSATPSHSFTLTPRAEFGAKYTASSLTISAVRNCTTNETTWVTTCIDDPVLVTTLNLNFTAPLLVPQPKGIVRVFFSLGPGAETEFAPPDPIPFMIIPRRTWIFDPPIPTIMYTETNTPLIGITPAAPSEAGEIQLQITLGNFARSSVIPQFTVNSDCSFTYDGICVLTWPEGSSETQYVQWYVPHTDLLSLVPTNVSDPITQAKEALVLTNFKVKFYQPYQVNRKAYLQPSDLSVDVLPLPRFTVTGLPSNNTMFLNQLSTSVITIASTIPAPSLQVEALFNVPNAGLGFYRPGLQFPAATGPVLNATTISNARNISQRLFTTEAYVGSVDFIWNVAGVNNTTLTQELFTPSGPFTVNVIDAQVMTMIYSYTGGPWENNATGDWIPNYFPPEKIYIGDYINVTVIPPFKMETEGAIVSFVVTVTYSNYVDRLEFNFTSDDPSGSSGWFIYAPPEFECTVVFFLETFQHGGYFFVPPAALYEVPVVRRPLPGEIDDTFSSTAGRYIPPPNTVILGPAGNYLALVPSNIDPCRRYGSLCLNGATCKAILPVNVNLTSTTLQCNCATGFVGPTCSTLILTCDGCISSYSGNATATLYGLGFEHIHNIFVAQTLPAPFGNITVVSSSSSELVTKSLESGAWSNAVASRKTVQKVQITLPSMIAYLKNQSSTTTQAKSTVKHQSKESITATTPVTPKTTNPPPSYQPLAVWLTYEEQPDYDFRVSLNHLLFYTASSCLDVGTFGEDGSGGCRPCPEHAYCPGGGRAWPEAGYWSVNEYAYPMPCQIPSSCPGVNPTIAQSSGANEVVTSQCAAEYDGTACAECAPEFFKVGKRCFSCDSGDGDKAYLISIVIVAAGIILALSVAVASATPRRLSKIVAAFLIIQNIVTIGKQSLDELPGGASGIAQVFNQLSLINWDIQVFKPGCVFPQMPYLLVFGYTMGLVGAMIVMFFLAAMVRFKLKSILYAKNEALGLHKKQNQMKNRAAAGGRVSTSGSSVDSQDSEGSEDGAGEDISPGESPAGASDEAKSEPKPDEAAVLNPPEKGTKYAATSEAASSALGKKKKRRVAYDPFTLEYMKENNVTHNPSAEFRADVYELDPREDFKQRAIHSALIVAMLFYLKITTMCIRIVQCSEATNPLLAAQDVSSDEDINQFTETALYMDADYSTPCYVGAHLYVAIFLLFFAPLYCLVFPVVLFRWLCRVFIDPNTTSRWISWMCDNVSWMRPLNWHTRDLAVVAERKAHQAQLYRAEAAQHQSAQKNKSIEITSSLTPEKLQEMIRFQRHINMFGWFLIDLKQECFWFHCTQFALSLVFAITSNLLYDPKQQLFVMGTACAFECLIVTWNMPYHHWTENLLDTVVLFVTALHAAILLGVQPGHVNAYFITLILFMCIVCLVVNARTVAWRVVRYFRTGKSLSSEEVDDEVISTKKKETGDEGVPSEEQPPAAKDESGEKDSAGEGSKSVSPDALPSEPSAKKPSVSIEKPLNVADQGSDQTTPDGTAVAATGSAEGDEGKTAEPADTGDRSRSASVSKHAAAMIEMMPSKALALPTPATRAAPLPPLAGASSIKPGPPVNSRQHTPLSPEGNPTTSAAVSARPSGANTPQMIVDRSPSPSQSPSARLRHRQTLTALEDLPAPRLLGPTNLTVAKPVPLPGLTADVKAEDDEAAAIAAAALLNTHMERASSATLRGQAKRPPVPLGKDGRPEIRRASTVADYMVPLVITRPADSDDDEDDQRPGGLMPIRSMPGSPRRRRSLAGSVQGSPIASRGGSRVGTPSPGASPQIAASIRPSPAASPAASPQPQQRASSALGLTPSPDALALGAPATSTTPAVPRSMNPPGHSRAWSMQSLAIARPPELDLDPQADGEPSASPLSPTVPPISSPSNSGAVRSPVPASPSITGTPLSPAGVKPAVGHIRRPSLNPLSPTSPSARNRSPSASAAALLARRKSLASPTGSPVQQPVATVLPESDEPPTASRALSALEKRFGKKLVPHRTFGFGSSAQRAPQ